MFDNELDPNSKFWNLRVG